MAAASIQKQLVALGLKNNGILYRNSAVESAIRINQRQITTP